MSIQSRRSSFLVVPVSLARFCSPPEVKCPVFRKLKNGEKNRYIEVFFAILIKVGYIYLISWKRVEPEGSDVDAMGSRDDKPGGGGTAI